MDKVKIEKSENGYKISINGLDVSKYVTHLFIEMRALTPPVVSLSLVPSEIDIPEDIMAELFLERENKAN